MPKNDVIDPITDQEIALARLVLSGDTTHRQAAEAGRLNPDSAAYIKAKPSVEHRAGVQQQLVQQEVDGLRRVNVDREQVLNRLWELAKLGPDMTGGSITGQVKALSMIVAMQNFIPDRHSLPSENKSAPVPEPAPGSVAKAPPAPGPGQSTVASRVPPSAAPKTVPLFNSIPDLGIPFSIEKNPLNPFVRPR
jgi:hypothetical protein